MRLQSLTKVTGSRFLISDKPTKNKEPKLNEDYAYCTEGTDLGN